VTVLKNPNGDLDASLGRLGRGRKLPCFPKPSDEIERLINELIVAVDKVGLGQYRIHFYEGGLVDINLNKKPARRRRALPQDEECLTSAPVRKF